MNQLQCSGLLTEADVGPDGYAVCMDQQEFIDRFRDITFKQSDYVEPTVEACTQILVDAGINDYEMKENKILLYHDHESYLHQIRDTSKEEIPASLACERGLAFSQEANSCSEKPHIASTNDVSTDTNDVSHTNTGQDNDASAKKQSSDGKAPSGSRWISDWLNKQEAGNSPVGWTPTYEASESKETQIQMKSEKERKILDTRMWDKFQMMPREQQSLGGTFRPVFKIFKLLCYFILFCFVLGTAVINKICILMMTSSITKEATPEIQWPAKTMLIFSMCIPYALWFVTYSGKSMFGSNAWPSFSLLCTVLVLELLHTFGLCLLVFRVLPLLDMLRGLIVLGNIYIIPAMLKAIFEGADKSTSQKRKFISFLLNFGAVLIQIGSIVACCVFGITMTTDEKEALRKAVISGEQETLGVISRPHISNNSSLIWELPVALVCISLSYWENFVDGDLTIFGRTVKLQRWKKYLHHAKPRLYIIASVWKIGWVIAFAMILQPGFTFNLSYTAQSDLAWHSTSLNNSETFAPLDNQTQNLDTPTDGNSESAEEPEIFNPFRFSENTVKHFELYGILYIQLFSVIILTYCGSTACKMCMQLFGFSLPLILTTPLSMAVVILQCLYKFLPTGVFVWVSYEEDGNLWILHIVWLVVLWLSELFIVSHIWFPCNGRMEKADRLFIVPLRCGILTDQSMMLRRRKNDHDTVFLNEDSMSSVEDPNFYKADDTVPQIYACATMWHETRSEMTQLLKSIFRMDSDHSARYLAQKFYKIRDPDYYEFEAHIFFDDAMELSDDDRLVPNMFVADLMDCIDEALSCVHERQMSLGPPIRTPTPYGGRLTWRLPGGTKMITHLKDKHKIRHKKRWSQVMYMYYLLGYRILAQPESQLQRDLSEAETHDSEFQRVKLTDAQLKRRRKAAHFNRSVIFNYVPDDVHVQAENTYILTLDGDVDFNPDAVRLLVDRLKTNKKVGAACGRIHPTGSGPMLWYQQFEYAIGHWLQKATEHVFGCVLCAPGCFSLFRGSSLMDDNVARTYAMRATEAGHYIQYDQGEDRWLSTLLLQQGYKIEYCAASDALTHVPETFSEFFNQRRRWGPSTLANIVDLLGSWKSTVKVNDNVSTLYILYQFCMLVSTILGPATILLMMAGAFTVVFKTNVIESYLMAILPPIAFIILCIYAKPSTQMVVASFMSALYAIVMTIVLVGTIGSAFDGGLTNPNVIFLSMLTLVFFVSAVMHPEEFSCVIAGALYFICLPTGYLLLTIYFLANMHIVSWGTREIPQRQTKEEIEEEKRIAEEKRKKKDEKKKGFFGWLGLSTMFTEMVEMFKQLRQDSQHNEQKSKTDGLLEELINEIRRSREPLQRPRSKSNATMTNDKDLEEHREIVAEIKTENLNSSASPDGLRNAEHPLWLKNEDFDNPAWLHSPVTGYGPMRSLTEKENIFWKQIITRYLHPINEDKVHQEKVAADLKNLRNNVVFGFFMTSAIWIALSMELEILQENLKDKLFFRIPKFMTSDYLAFEPLGLIFLVFFSVILCVQFVGMFAHRWGTVLHMLSITDISCGKTFTEKDKVRETITKAMELQKLCNIENEPQPDYDEPIIDYDDFDEEDDTAVEETASTDTVPSLPASFKSADPPSYHSSVQANATLSRRQKDHEVFDKRGYSRASALRKAFEKRYRNETQGQCSYDVGDRAYGLYHIHEASDA